jgi:phosphate-selective porin O/P
MTSAHGTRLLVMAAALLLASAPRARAQVEIKDGEDVSFKLGILGQFQADTLDDPAVDGNTNNLFVRRIRLIAGGQVAKGVTFFVETDAPNLGKATPTGKNIQPSMIVQDVYAEFSGGKAFAVDAGLMFIPFSRNSLQSAATLLPIDYGADTFNQSAATQIVDRARCRLSGEGLPARRSPGISHRRVSGRARRRIA